MPAPTDINPTTGKAYAINPATGNWDDNFFAQNYGGGGGGGGEFPTWSFNYEQEQKAAFEKLRPYYEKILNFAKGDLNLAKEIIGFTYKQGMRETREQYEISSREEALLRPAEREQLATGLSRRGLIGSRTPGLPTGGLAGQETRKLTERQNIRQQVMENARASQEARAIKEKQFETKKAETGLAKETQQLGREHEAESIKSALGGMGIQQVAYGAKVGEWQAAEQRRVAEMEQKQQEETMKQYYT